MWTLCWQVRFLGAVLLLAGKLVNKTLKSGPDYTTQRHSDTKKIVNKKQKQRKGREGGEGRLWMDGWGLKGGINRVALWPQLAWVATSRCVHCEVAAEAVSGKPGTALSTRSQAQENEKEGEGKKTALTTLTLARSKDLNKETRSQTPLRLRQEALGFLSLSTFVLTVKQTVQVLNSFRSLLLSLP